MKLTLRTPLLFMAGTLLVQLAWIWAVPPFRGIDEFDHSYRAASVAEGFWSPKWTEVPDGRGVLLPVPEELVIDAQDVCTSYEYVGRANCQAVSKLDRGLVTVASAAGRYNPVFYWVVGTPSRLASGSMALYIMRATSALICSLLVAIAAWAIGRWAKTGWPLVSLALALTPVTLYGFMLPAPNGVEMAAALCLWSGLLGLASSSTRHEHVRAYIVVSTLGAVVLVGVRTLGPLWLLLILLVGLVVPGPARFRRTVLASRRSALLSCAIVGAATTAAALWSLDARPNTLEKVPYVPGNPWTKSAAQVPLWFLQSIAAFPTRGEQAPSVVYASAAVVFIAFLVFAIRAASFKNRAVIATLCFLSLGLPYAFTVITYHGAGAIWQGRYTLPLSFGVVLVAGYALDAAAPVRSRFAGPAILGGWLSLTAAHTASTVSVHLGELAESPLSGDPRWLTAPTWSVGVTTVAGMLALALAIRSSRIETNAQLVASTVRPHADETPNDSPVALR